MARLHLTSSWPRSRRALISRGSLASDVMHLMEVQLVEAVLSGRLSVQAALAWALGDGDEPPPIELRLGSPWRAAGGPRPALRPADFRVRCRRRCRRLLALPASSKKRQ